MIIKEFGLYSKIRRHCHSGILYVYKKFYELFGLRSCSHTFFSSSSTMIWMAAHRTVCKKVIKFGTLIWHFWWPVFRCNLYVKLSIATTRPMLPILFCKLLTHKVQMLNNCFPSESLARSGVIVLLCTVDIIVFASMA